MTEHKNTNVFTGISSFLLFFRFLRHKYIIFLLHLKYNFSLYVSQYGTMLGLPKMANATVMCCPLDQNQMRMEQV